MSPAFRWLAAAGLLLCIGSSAWADAGPPCPFNLFIRRQGPERTFTPLTNVDPAHDIVILIDPKLEQPELRIPRRMVFADASRKDISTRNAMAGLAISAAFVGGGLWCMRYRPTQIPRKKLLAAGVVVLLLLGGLTIGGFANAQPALPPTPLNPLTTWLGDAEVTVQIVDEGNEIQLIVPSKLADKIAAR